MSEHTHPHEHAQPEEGPPTYHQLLAVAVRELLIEKGIFSADEMRAAIEDMESHTPALGAKVVARAWTDSEFKARLLEDGKRAIGELGIDIGALRLVVVENTPDVHNLVVCTLCSCYPRPLLGLPPGWYKSRPYRSRAVREPRAVLREFGTEIPDHVTVRVHDSTAEMRYLVLPIRPEGSEAMSEEELSTLVTRDSVIGVARAARPRR